MQLLLRVLAAIEKDVKKRHAIGVRDNYVARRVHVREKMIEYLQRSFPDGLPKARVELKSPGTFESIPQLSSPSRKAA